MTTTRNLPMSFRKAFEAEHTRRDMERTAREDAERAQQEADHARSVQLHDALAAEQDFLNEKRLVLDHTRYAVTLDHEDYRLRAYFEDGLDIGHIEVLVDCVRRAGLDQELAHKYLLSDEGRQEVVASDVYARRLGINGVPCFIVNRKYAVSGAQPPSAFVEVFKLAERDAATSTAQSIA